MSQIVMNRMLRDHLKTNTSNNDHDRYIYSSDRRFCQINKNRIQNYFQPQEACISCLRNTMILNIGALFLLLNKMRMVFQMGGKGLTCRNNCTMNDQCIDIVR